MPRARNIKPGYFKNEYLAECEPLARILFAGLWCLADREGRLELRPKRIKAEILPYDDCDIEELLEQLNKKEFIFVYEINGERYAWLPTFTQHQNPHRNEKPSELPAPDMYREKVGSPPVIDGSTREMHQRAPADSLILNPESLILNPESLYTNIADIFNIECVSMPKVTKLNKARKTAIKARYKEWESVDTFRTLFQKAEASDFLSGRNGKWTSCNFDWLLKESNALKVLEGNYDNKQGSQQETAID